MEKALGTRLWNMANETLIGAMNEEEVYKITDFGSAMVGREIPSSLGNYDHGLEARDEVAGFLREWAKALSSKNGNDSEKQEINEK